MRDNPGCGLIYQAFYLRHDGSQGAQGAGCVPLDSRQRRPPRKRLDMAIGGEGREDMRI